MFEVLLLYLIISSRINFLQRGRDDDFGEQRCRQQFGRKFDWLSFNATLVASQISSRVAIVFDSSYISKSGKYTPYLGRFWSGCVKMAKHVFEIFGIDTQMETMDVLDYYRTRFQIEFCYWDVKQFIGLNDSQSRDLNKLHFHFNASLINVNQAKVKALEKGTVLSMVSVKVLCYNVFLIKQFIFVLRIELNEEINRRLWEERIRFAAIAA